jgi:hypothetical protein
MEPCEMPRADIDRMAAGHRQMLARIRRDYPAMALFAPQDILCDPRACRARVEGRLVYANIDHLNEFGAEVVIRGFAAKFPGFSASANQ